MYTLEKENNIYNIVEDNTTFIIKSFEYKDFEKARSVLKKLKGGCGFNGFTPAFFLKK